MELRQRHLQRFALPGSAARQGRRAQGRAARGRVGIRPETGISRGRTLPQLRRADGVQRAFVHRVRRLRRYLPDGLHHLHRQWRGKRSAPAPQRAGQEPDAGHLRFGRAQDRPHHGEGRGCLPALRPVRRTLSHRGVGHAEISFGHDPGRTRMPNPINSTNDFVVKFANVNGSGSASANLLFAKSVLRMGVPVATRNIFPSNIQGLPTWYEVRVSGQGYRGRRGGVDLMVPMNPQTWDQDLAEVEPGGYLFYDSSKPLPKSKFRDDINVIGMPLTEISNREYTDSRQRQLFKNIIYVGALSALLDIDLSVVERLIGEQFRGKDKLIAPNIHALHLGRDYALQHL